MGGNNKILTVSYGTFSCTLEGFDDPFSTMKDIAEYFRELAASDRFFGAEPPTPDAEMLAQIAARSAQRRVEAEVGENTLKLRQTQQVATPQPAPAAPPQPAPAPAQATQEPSNDDIAALLAASSDTETAPAEAAQDIPQDTAEQEETTVVSAPTLGAAGADTIAARDDVVSAAMAASEGDPQATAAECIAAEADSTDDDLAEADQHEPAAQGNTPQSKAPAALFEPTTGPAASIAERLARIQQVVAQGDSAEDAAESLTEALFSDEDDANSDDFLISVLQEAMADTAHDAPQEASPQPTAEAPPEEATDAPAEMGEDAAAPPSQETAAEPEAAESLEVDLSALTAEAEDAAEEAVAEDPTEEAVAEDATEEAVAEGATEEAVAEDATEEAVAEDPTEEAVAEDPTEEAVAEDPTEEAAETAEAAPEDIDQPPPAPETPADIGAEPPSRPAPVQVSVVRKAPEAAPTMDTDLSPEEEAELQAELAAIEAEVETVRRAGAASLPPAAEADAAALDRLFADTDQRLRGEETTRRHANISHLKAAVAARQADPQPDTAKEDATDHPYRSDLASAVRPRRPQTPGAKTQRPTTPLILVSEQRVDVEGGAIRPRRVTRAGQDEASPRQAQARRASSLGFAAFAADMGAVDTLDVLEAAAAYATSVEGSDSFSRPQVLRLTAEAVADYTRDQGQVAFAELLRSGLFEKHTRGTYRLSRPSRFQEPARQRASG